MKNFFVYGSIFHKLLLFRPLCCQYQSCLIGQQRCYVKRIFVVKACWLQTVTDNGVQVQNLRVRYR